MPSRHSSRAVAPGPDGRAQERAGGPALRPRAPRQRRPVALAAAGVVVVLALLVAAKLLSPAVPAAQDGSAPDALVAQVTSVPAAALEQVGRGSVASLPTPVRAAVQRGPGGHPVVTYIGAEYCPYCAAERWPLIVALSRFGSFTGLRPSHSATDDVYPGTATFSFVGASYSSAYLDFSSVELQSNTRSGGRYQTLQTPTAAQDALLRTYDAPPYVPSASAGAIPFIDIANQYVLSGASYDVGLLRGLSQEQIASLLQSGTSEQARAILGTANVLTAAVCAATDQAPAEVCAGPAVRSLEATLAASPAPTRAP